MDERGRELLERLVAPGKFPQMSASEAHELYDAVHELLDEREHCRQHHMEAGD